MPENLNKETFFEKVFNYEKNKDWKFEGDLPCVIDFWAPWCGPCRIVGPLIEELASEYVGKVTFGKLNVDENITVPSKFGVRSIPTLLVFKDGQAVDTIVGACPKPYLESKFKPYIERDT